MIALLEEVQLPSQGNVNRNRLLYIQTYNNFGKKPDYIA